MMKNENGQEITRKVCKGDYVDDECRVRDCKNAEYKCIIQELKKQKGKSA